MAITLARLKSSLYCDCADTTAHDDVIEELMGALIEQAIDYMNNSDYVDSGDFDEVLERKVCKQIAYEFRQRGSLGLSSVTYPDGSINKYEVEEWLPDVKVALDRRRHISLSGE